MKSKLENFGTGWFALQLGISSSEIELLIDALLSLKESKHGHFVIASKGGGAGGIENIEIYLLGDKEIGNMQLLGGDRSVASEG